MKSLISAIKLLTVIPIDTRNRIEPGRMELTLLCFPLVGMLLGGICAVVMWAGAQVFPPAIAAALAVLALVVATGALHVDGLADTADGLFGGATRERKLEIMRDTRVGAFGIVAIVFLLGIKVLALASVAANTKGSNRDILVLFMTPVVGRWLILLAAGVCAYAREGEGTGRSAVDAARPSHFLIWLPLVALLGWLCLGVGGLLMLGAVLAVVLAAILCIQWEIGGMTGDTLGAVCEVGEMSFLLSFFIATG